MTSNSIDWPEEAFEPDTRIIVLRYFHSEREARIYAARLKEAHIRHFLSNANMNTALPLSPGGIGLHIREDDLSRASSILARLDYEKTKRRKDESFHDADLEDIAYYKALHQKQSTNVKWLLVLIGLLIGLVVTRALLRALGVVELWRDAF